MLVTKVSPENSNNKVHNVLVYLTHCMNPPKKECCDCGGNHASSIKTILVFYSALCARLLP